MGTILFYGAYCDRKHRLTTGLTVVSSIVLEQMEREYIVKKVNIADKGIGNRGGAFFVINRTLQFMAIFLKLFFVLLCNRIDVVYYQPVYSKMGILRDYFALRIITLFKKKIVGHALGIAEIDRMIKSNSFFGKKCLWNFCQMSKIIVEGEIMKQQFVSLPNFRSRIIVIPNGLKEESDCEKKPKIFHNGDTFKLLYLSNLIFSKGYFDVLRAMDILVNKEKLDVECVFAGLFYQTLEDEDNDRELSGEEAFKTYVKTHNLKNRILYSPGLYGVDKQKAFLKSSAFVLPTYYSAEGQPMAILEAMSYGCVPIVTKHGHIPNMINENNGCFVEKKSPESISSRVLELVENNALYNYKSANAINDFKTKFSGDVFSKTVVGVIKQYISN